MKVLFNDLYNLHKINKYKFVQSLKKLIRNSNFIGGKEVFNLLYDSIKLQLRSDVPVTTTLTSGLDSSSILALANKIKQNSINQFIFILWGIYFIYFYLFIFYSSKKFYEKFIELKILYYFAIYFFLISLKSGDLYNTYNWMFFTLFNLYNYKK